MKPHCSAMKNSQLQVRPNLLSNLKAIPWIHAVIPILTGLVTGVFYYLVTRQGSVVGYDSYYYLRAAEGLLSGAGFGWIGSDGGFLPLTHYPPVYSILLAVLAKIFSLSILEASHLAIILICAVSAGLLAWYIRDLTGSIFLPASALILFVCHQPFINIQVSAMSEGLFFLEFIVCLIIYTKLVKQFNWRNMIILGVGLAIMVLTRYAAFILAVCFILAILITKKNRSTGVSAAGVLSLMAFSPLIGWLARNYFLTESLTNRQILVHLPDTAQYYIFLRSMKLWFLPLENLPFGSAVEMNITELAAAGILTALLFYFIYRIGHYINLALESEKQTIRLLGMVAVAYPVFLWMTYAFVDASTRWTTRILSPWLFAISLLFILFFRHFGEEFHPRNRWAPCSLILIAGILAAGNGHGAVLSLAQNGDGFTSPDVRASITRMMQNTPNTPTRIYTNNVPLLYFNTHSEVLALPEKNNTIIDEKNSDFQAERAEMKSDLQTSESMLVLSKPYSTKNGVYPNFSTLVDGLKTYYEDENIVVYGN